MPRQLPWLKQSGSNSKNTGAQSKSSASHPGKRQRVTYSSTRSNAARTPSTSPPPEVPTESPMKLFDAAWIMVEDEFYSTAQLFTRHLHQAEYHRHNALSLNSSHQSMDPIQRPVTGSNLSKASKVGQRHKRQKETISRALQDIGIEGAAEQQVATDSSNDEDEVAIGDKNLASLLHGKSNRQAQKTSLARLVGNPKSNTRAAAGFEKQSSPRLRARETNLVSSVPGKIGKTSTSPVDVSEESTNDELDTLVMRSYRSATWTNKSDTHKIGDTDIQTRRSRTRIGIPRPGALNLDKELSPDSMPQQAGSRLANEDQNPDKLALADELPSLNRLSRTRKLVAHETPPKSAEREMVQLDEIPTFLY